MKNREPYQIIIMRPTGGKPVMTVRSFWVRLILISIMVLLVAMVIVVAQLLNARHTQDDQQQMITMQSEELRDLNILLTQKDEEIISLKKKLSMSITHKAAPILEIAKPLPKIHPPIVEVTGVSLRSGQLMFRIVNLRSQSKKVAQGYLYAVFKKGKDYACYPSVKLDEGLPIEKKEGHAFIIKNYKPMSIKIPQSIGNWDTVNFYIFDGEEKLRLAMPIKRVQIQ